MLLGSFFVPISSASTCEVKGELLALARGTGKLISSLSLWNPVTQVHSRSQAAVSPASAVEGAGGTESPG